MQPDRAVKSRVFDHKDQCFWFVKYFKKNYFVNFQIGVLFCRVFAKTSIITYQFFGTAVQRNVSFSQPYHFQLILTMGTLLKIRLNLNLVIFGRKIGYFLRRKNLQNWWESFLNAERDKIDCDWLAGKVNGGRLFLLQPCNKFKYQKQNQTARKFYCPKIALFQGQRDATEKQHAQTGPRQSQKNQTIKTALFRATKNEEKR